MKKLLILALVGGIALSASAQRSVDRYPNAHKNYPRHSKVMNREALERRIDKINHDYDAQIRYVKNNPHLRNKEKKKQIKQLEKDRKVAINRLRDKHQRNYYRDGYSFNK